MRRTEAEGSGRRHDRGPKTDDEMRSAEAQLPPQVREKLEAVYKWLIETNEYEVHTKLDSISARLVAFIPDYIATTHTVIGTPKDGLPIAYDSLESRYRHTFLIGRSGIGKSTVITNFVAQDINRGYGVIVLSPDQDLMHRIVPYIPEHRLDDVIYFDPSDTALPLIGFNPFAFEPPDDPQDYQLLKNRKAGETYTILERTLGLSTQEGMQTLLNNAMHGLIGRPTADINELRRLLDPKERAMHQEVSNDPNVDDYTREFWHSYAAEGANTLVYRNLIRRMANLLRPPLLNIFSTHALSFHREINEHARILLVDLSNFSRDSMEAKISAQLLIAAIQQTILRRDKMAKADYIPYLMYIDEFQNFADANEKSIGDMAEQLRKYSFGLTLTSLVASDLTPRLFDTIIGVMSTFICLSISAKDAGRFASEMHIKRAGRDSFDSEALTRLQRGQAYVLTPPLDSAVFVQMPAEPLGNLPKLSTTIADLKRRSKANFGVTMRPQESSVADPDIPDEPKAEPHDTPPAPQQSAKTATPKKEPPVAASRRRRNRFDEDAGEAEIEIT